MDRSIEGLRGNRKCSLSLSFQNFFSHPPTLLPLFPRLLLFSFSPSLFHCPKSIAREFGEICRPAAAILSETRRRPPHRCGAATKLRQQTPSVHATEWRVRSFRSIFYCSREETVAETLRPVWRRRYAALRQTLKVERFFHSRAVAYATVRFSVASGKADRRTVRTVASGWFVRHQKQPGASPLPVAVMQPLRSPFPSLPLFNGGPVHDPRENFTIRYACR